MMAQFQFRDQPASHLIDKHTLQNVVPDQIHLCFSPWLNLHCSWSSNFWGNVSCSAVRYSTHNLLHSQMKILTSHFIGRAASGEYACTCGSRKQQLTSYGATPLDIAIAMLEKYSSNNKLLFIHYFMI